MKPSCRSSLSRCTGAQRQRGAVLIVALIVLVALGLASLALLRSVDILGLISGNLSLQRSALTATDIGVNAAMAKLEALPNRTAPSTANCYFDVALAADERGIPNLLKTDTFGTEYPACKEETANGEKLLYVIDRQCSRTSVAEPKTCVLAQISPAGCDQHCFDTSRIEPVYRVTVRVDSAKNTNSYSQLIVY
jgi:type IV pilus assembly protein PilX